MNSTTESEDKLRSLAGERVVLVGIGNPFRGDDGAGVILARRLEAAGVAAVIDAGASPENQFSVIRGFNPDAVLLADAYAAPTESRWGLFSRSELFSGPASTHNSSLSIMMEFLEKETGADIYLLGIRAERRVWEEGLSPTVEETLDYLVSLLTDHAVIR